MDIRKFFKKPRLENDEIVSTSGVNWGSHGVALATPENIIGSQEYLFATPKNYDFNYQKIEISI